MGTKLVRRKGLILLLAVLACRPTPSAPSRAEPRIRATVVTIQTTLQPQNKSLTHEIVIAGGRARSSDEADSWRLFDLRKGQVTFVDEIAKTSRDLPLAALIDQRRKELAQPLSLPLPRAELLATGAKRMLLGVEASEHVVRLGGYQRHLWIARHPALPNDLFAMMQASAPRSSPLAGVWRAADEVLMAVVGFPLLDHAELPYGNKKMVVERSVVKIEQKDVPEVWLSLSLSRREATGSAVTPSQK
jgi:hypothetical protein